WASHATTLRWGELAARVEPSSFIQVNQQQSAVLYERVLAALGDLEGSRVVDAYAGSGMLSCAIAARGADVVCIEESTASARLGVLNARLNGVDGRTHYVPRRVEDALPAVASERPVDAIVLDPPRAGCAGQVTGWLALCGPQRVVCVSCDVATLARDLHVLVASGPYVLESLEIVDMFPQTHHVECVAALRRDAEPCG
ncbi:MAG TPA: RsmD family RNA methyltransferase, partial [Candidatus Dormibacteraeota bacterium]|nr:RsmD family RNA methyltransferase [Candidatus Dormibacteraeota bacterium]